MLCPFCSHNRTNVTNSRPRRKTASVWRRRQCPKCERNFSTTESISLQDDILVQYPSNDTSSPYNRGVLLLSIAECFAHDVPRGHQAAWWLTETVEGSIMKLEYASEPVAPPSAAIIDTRQIASICHQILERYDSAAAIQYAAKHNLL